MNQPVVRQSLALALSALTTFGVLAGLDGLAGQQRQHAAAQWAADRASQPAANPAPQWAGGRAAPSTGSGAADQG